MKKSGLTIVEREYLKLVLSELRKAIRTGEPNRAAMFAKEAARLQRKKLQNNNQGNNGT